MVHVLIEILKDGSTELRQNAVSALGLIGPAAQPAVPQLIEMMIEDSSELRRDLAELLVGPYRGARGQGSRVAEEAARALNTIRR